MLQFMVFASVVFAKCTTMEIFKEWRELTNLEKRQYMGAVACLANAKSNMKSDFDKPLDYFREYRGQHPRPSSRLDDFTYGRIRVQLAAWSFVNHPQYLPWHRVFLRLFDAALRQLCSYKGPLPYWDLSVRQHETKELWPYFDLTGNVMTGTLTSSIPEEHRVERTSLSLKGFTFFSAEQIKVIMQQPNYDSLRILLEKSQNEFLGNSIGDIGQRAFAPNDPLFYLLQRNVDRLWYLWQQANPLIALSYYSSQGAQLTDKMHFYGLYDPLTIQDALNPESGKVNGLMCFKYSKPITMTNKMVPFKRMH